MTIGINVHGEGGASINGRPVDATDIRVLRNRVPLAAIPPMESTFSSPGKPGSPM